MSYHALNLLCRVSGANIELTQNREMMLNEPCIDPGEILAMGVEKTDEYLAGLKA